jgi:hypothetical protein
VYSALTFVVVVCGLFIDAVISSGYIASSDGMNNELERIWEEVVMA